jgi:hypothetical protein
MLLSRVAEAVYWAGRYLERAEDMSRIVQVHGETHIDLRDGARCLTFAGPTRFGSNVSGARSSRRHSTTRGEGRSVRRRWWPSSSPTGTILLPS